MSDIELPLNDIVNKIHILQNSFNYIIDNSSSLEKEEFIVTTIATSSELKDIQNTLNSLLETF